MESNVLNIAIECETKDGWKTGIWKKMETIKDFFDKEEIINIVNQAMIEAEEECAYAIDETKANRCTIKTNLVKKESDVYLGACFLYGYYNKYTGFVENDCLISMNT